MNEREGPSRDPCGAADLLHQGADTLRQTPRGATPGPGRGGDLPIRGGLAHHPQRCTTFPSRPRSGAQTDAGQG
jgi:hypothetical protein